MTSTRTLTMARQARARELQSKARARRLRRINEGLEILLEAAVAQVDIEIDLRDRQSSTEIHLPQHAQPAVAERSRPTHSADPAWLTEIVYPDDRQLAS